MASPDDLTGLRLLMHGDLESQKCSLLVERRRLVQFGLWMIISLVLAGPKLLRGQGTVQAPLELNFNHQKITRRLTADGFWCQGVTLGCVQMQRRRGTCWAPALMPAS